MKILITGGAGFIGSSLVTHLNTKQNHHDIVVLDSLEEQIHGKNFEHSYLFNQINNKCTFIKGNVKNINDVRKAIDGIDVIVHLTAETGTGQSMYQINNYNETNIMGMSNIFQAISDNHVPIKKIILASSRAVYGEGKFLCKEHGYIYPKGRRKEDMLAGDFNVHCPICNQAMDVVPTTEDSPLIPNSLYAFTKLAQEKMVETMCSAMDIDYTILRFQNVYGEGQSLKNPYTGILSIFSNLLLQNQSVNIFENGLESRDFIHVKDIVTAIYNAIEVPESNGQVLNVGSGLATSVLEIASILKDYYHSNSELNITGDFRIGDIAHNVADITKANDLLNFKPGVTLEHGLKEFSAWVYSQESNADITYEQSLLEMEDQNMFFRHNNNK